MEEIHPYNAGAPGVGELGEHDPRKGIHVLDDQIPGERDGGGSLRTAARTATTTGIRLAEASIVS